jgi:hypothetical protein
VRGGHFVREMTMLEFSARQNGGRGGEVNRFFIIARPLSTGHVTCHSGLSSKSERLCEMTIRGTMAPKSLGQACAIKTDI